MFEHIMWLTTLYGLSIIQFKEAKYLLSLRLFISNEINLMGYWGLTRVNDGGTLGSPRSDNRGNTTNEPSRYLYSSALVYNLYATLNTN